MLIASDYKELLKILKKHKVKYLIIGAYAVIHYTEPRYTKDLDVWIRPEINNAEKVYAALKEFGAPLRNISVEDFIKKQFVYQIGVEPVRVDVLMGIGKIDFDVAYKHRKVATFDGIKVNILGINELIASKKKANRDSDKIDLKKLAERSR